MLYDNNSEELEILHEWGCSVRSKRYLILMHLVIYTIFFIVFTSAFFNKWQQFYLSIIIPIFWGIAAIIALFLYVYKKFTIKHVAFTRSHVYIENIKLDLCFVDSIAFVKLYKCGKNVGYSKIKFCMTFLPNKYHLSKVLFCLTFPRNHMAENYQIYDYEQRFIKVIESWAQNRRSMNAQDHV